MTQRPVSADWRPTADAAARRLRAAVYTATRQFFDRRGVLEVETPLWSQAGNPDPNIESVLASVSDQQSGFLRSSPEFAMKRLLAAGSGPIYELGRVFRRGETGRWHNPEFTMLEWYRPGFDYRQLAEETVELVQQLAGEYGHTLSVARLDYRAAVSAAVGIDPITASDAELSDLVNQRGWFEGKLSRNASLDLILSLGVVPSWPRQLLTVLFDYPASQAALARIHPEESRLALRFELFWGNVELANGYDELLEAEPLAERFAAENQLRADSGKAVMPVDYHLLAALGNAVEPTAGVALGVDRLLACLIGAEQLSEVMNFPMECA